MNPLLLLLPLTPLLLVSCASSSEVRRTPPKPAVSLSPRSAVPVLAGDTLYSIAQKAYQAKDYLKAYDYFLAAAPKVSTPHKSLEAHYWALRCSGKLNRHPETVELSNILLKNRNWTEGQFIEISQYRLRALEAQNLHLDALQQVQTMVNNVTFNKDSESLKAKATDLIQSKLNKDDLGQFVEQSQNDSLKSMALLKLGEMSMDDRNNSQARVFLNQAIAVAPQTDSARRSSELLMQIDTVNKVEPKTVGVVLPMTGKYAAISQKTLRGIQMGLGLYGTNQTSFRLAIVDSEGNPDNARRGVEKLVKEDSVIGIIGSVLSKTAPAVASKSSELGVPSIALSQKYGVTELGSQVFRNSLTSEMQVRALVRTAMEDLGMRKFAIIYPNDQYGVEYANLFWDEVLARGGSISSAQIYSPKETDFRDPVQRLVGTYYLEARADEYKLLLKEWADAQSKRSSRNLPPEELLPPVVDFDAIFIPDSAKALGQISAMLSYNGVRGVKLLGTNLWNVPGLAKRVGNSASQLLFVDSYVGSDSTLLNSVFVRDYKNEFGETPGVFEIQAYDSALMVRQLVSQGASSRESLTKALGQMKNFPGSMGPLSMTADREVQRPLISLGLENGNIVPFSPSVQK